jgi:uncharacterized protein YraI
MKFQHMLMVSIRLLVAGGIAGLLSILILLSLPTGSVYAQQPTGSIPTVTGTPAGPYVTVYSDQPFIDVYAGPSSYNYDRIGILAAGERAPALGYSQDGNWIEIVYYGVPDGKGWIYGPFVAISIGSLPRLSAPATATPRTTPTINPTYVAAFGLNLKPTRLPTFTSPASVKLPTFTPNTGGGSKVPFGLVILTLALIGILGAVISFLRGNR